MVVAARALRWSPGAAGRATVVSPIQCLLDGLAALLLLLCVVLCHDFLRRVDCFQCLSICCAGAPRSGGGGGGRGFVMAGSQSVGSGGRRILDADCRDGGAGRSGPVAAAKDEYEPHSADEPNRRCPALSRYPASGLAR
jgi:hypothetical protein